MGFIGDAISGTINMAAVNATNQANKEIQADVNATNRDIANQTNEYNYHIAQMSNEYNQQMLERQIQQEWEMWNAQNEYNSASSQRQRLEEAGLNPYLMMDGGSAGTASAMTSPSAQPAVVPQMQTGAPMQASQMQAPQMGSLSSLGQIGEEVISILSAKRDLENKDLLNDQLRIENQYRAQKLWSEIQKNYSSGRRDDSETVLNHSETVLNQIRQNWMDKQFNQDYESKKLDMFLKDAEIYGRRIANAQQMEVLKTLPQKLRNEVAEQTARIGLLYEQKRLTKQQVETEVEKTLNEGYKALLSGNELMNQGEMFDLQKKKLRAEILKTIYSTGPEGPLGLAQMWRHSWIGDHTGSNRSDDNDWIFQRGNYAQ